MRVDQNTEYYLIHSMGLNLKQIKDMSFNEIEKHCNDIIKQRIKDRDVHDTKISKKRKSK